MGDDMASWAVFIDGYPFVTGLYRSEVPYHKQRAEEKLKADTERKGVGQMTRKILLSQYKRHAEFTGPAYRVVKLVNLMKPAVGTYITQQAVADIISEGVQVTIIKETK